MGYNEDEKLYEFKENGKDIETYSFSDGSQLSSSTDFLRNYFVENKNKTEKQMIEVYNYKTGKTSKKQVSNDVYEITLIQDDIVLYLDDQRLDEKTKQNKEYGYTYYEYSIMKLR